MDTITINEITPEKIEIEEITPEPIEVKEVYVRELKTVTIEKTINQKGLNGKDGKDGIGKNGKDGKTPTKTELKALIKEVFPEDKLLEKLIKKMPKEELDSIEIGEDRGGQWISKNGKKMYIKSNSGIGPVMSTGVHYFLGLLDAPDSYVGQGGKVVKVKADESGLEFGTGGGGGSVASVVAGTGIAVDNTDAANPIVSSTITQYTDELAQDAVGTILTDSSEIDFTYNDGVPSITASIVAGSIDETKLDTSVNASLDLADTAVQPAGLSGYQLTSQKDSANGYAGLDAGGKINSAQIPDIAISDFLGNFTDTTTALANAGVQASQKGDWFTVDTSGGQSWIVTTSLPTTLADITQLKTPTDAVTSVFSRTGAVTAQNGDYTASNITNVPAGNIAAVTVQNALNELDTEKLSTTDATTTPTASKIVERDANANIYVNNYFANTASTVSAGGTTILTVGSARTQNLTGSSNQTFQLPDATTLSLSSIFEFNNNSSGSLTVVNAGSVSQYVVPAGGAIVCYCTSIGSANGAWDFHALAPLAATWSSGVTGLVMNSVLTTSPRIGSGASSSTAPSFIPQRGASTTGFGGDGTDLHATIAGTPRLTISPTGITATNFSGSSAGNNTGDQTITNSSDATSHTVTLSASGGSVQLIEGPNITLTTGGTASAGTVTIAATAGGTGDVVGPASSTDNAIARFDLATGKLIQNSGITIADGATGTLSGTNTGDQTSVSGNAGTATALQTARTIGTVTGDATSAGSSFDGSANNTNAITLATVNANVGSFGSATAAGTFTVNAKGLITAASNTTVTPAVGSITGLGTGVGAALAINVGTAGAPVLFNGAGGTPSSLTGTNITGTASGLTAGNVTTNANLTGDVTSVGNAATVVKLNGTSLAGLATGILKNTTTTGVPSIAVAGDFPTLNQNTTGSAATLTTTRAIYGNNFNGSAALTQVIASTYGGTGNGFTKISGPTTTEKTITIPDANMTITAAAATVLDDTTVGAMVDTLGGTTSTGTGGIARATSPTFVTPLLGTPTSGVLTNCTGLPTAGLVDDAVTLAKMAAGTAGNLITYDASGNPAAVATGTAGQVLTSNGTGAAPTMQTPAGGGTATTKAITQATHGLAVNDVIKFSGTTYSKAQADSAANAEVVGVVTTVTDANNFTFTMEGFATLGTLVSDTTYFLSPTTAGLLTATEPTTNGQISKPVLKTTSTTTGIITNMRGMEITSSGSGGIAWTEVTGTSQSASINNGYIANNASLVTITIPTTAVVGSIVRVAGSGAGGWKVAQNASEIIHFGSVNTTTGTGGSLASTNRYDAVELVCTVADTEWVVISSIGNLTIV